MRVYNEITTAVVTVVALTIKFHPVDAVVGDVEIELVRLILKWQKKIKIFLIKKNMLIFKITELYTHITCWIFY